MKKKSYFINERADISYNNGGHVMVGDKVKHNINNIEKDGVITNVDKGGISIKYDDGSGLDNASAKDLKKVAYNHLSTILNEFSTLVLSS